MEHRGNEILKCLCIHRFGRDARVGIRTSTSRLDSDRRSRSRCNKENGRDRPGLEVLVTVALGVCACCQYHDVDRHKLVDLETRLRPKRLRKLVNRGLLRVGRACAAETSLRSAHFSRSRDSTFKIFIEMASISSNSRKTSWRYSNRCPTTVGMIDSIHTRLDLRW